MGREASVGPRPAAVTPPGGAGKDVTVTATVGGAALAGKPVVKWFKGKWAEMGDKTARCRLRHGVSGDNVRGGGGVTYRGHREP